MIPEMGKYLSIKTTPRKKISMDNNSSKLIGLADKNLTFNENWLEKRIVKARKKQASLEN